LSKHHRDTIARIVSHAASTNIEWRQVPSMLEATGAATREHNGKLTVTLGSETETLVPPRAKDLDVQTIVDLRRMLVRAGYGPERFVVEEVSPDAPSG
jgi:hypothetical protein